MSDDSYSVFLSYNADDRQHVEQVAIYLEDEADLIPWFDQWKLIPGEPWVRNLERGLENSSSCAVFVGKSGEGPWQVPEVEAALRQQVRNPQFRVIPILLPDALRQPELPTFLAGNTWVDFRNGLDDDDARWRLECGIKGIAPGRGRPPSSSKEPTPSPETPEHSEPLPEPPPPVNSITVTMRRILRHNEGVKAVAISPDSEIIAGGAGQSFFPGEHAIRLWRSSDGHLLHELKGHTAWVTSVAFSPDGRTLASGGYDGTLRLWRVSDGKPLGNPIKHNHYVWSVIFSPDGEMILSGSGANVGGSVQVWRASDISLLYEQPHPYLVQTLAISPDGKQGACGMGWLGEEPARIWRTSDGEFQITLNQKDVASIAYSPDGKTLATGGGSVKIWDTSNGRCIRNLEGNENVISEVAFSPNGAILAAADDQKVQIWNVSDGRLLHTLHEHKKRINGITFSPDGKILATGGDDDCVRVWSVS